MLRIAPPLAIAILAGPIIFGLLATLLPAFGYFPPLGSDHFSFDPMVRLFERAGIIRSVFLSVSSGLVTTSIALISVAIFVAGWAGTPAFRAVQNFISPLLSVPHAAAAFGLAFLIAPSGWFVRLISPWLTGFDRPPDVLILHDVWGFSMMAGLVAKEIPFLLLVTFAALPQSDSMRLVQLGRTLGFGRVASFMFIVWPVIYRQIRLAVFAVIAYSTSVIDVAIILGPDSPAPLSPRILGWMNDPDIYLRFEASAGAMLQLGVTLLALGLWWGLEIIFARLRNYLAGKGIRFARDGFVRSLGLVLLVISASSVFAGLFLLAIWSIAGFWSYPDALPDQVSLKSWIRSLPNLWQPLWNSFVIGVCATGLAVIITLGALEREARTGKNGGRNALLIIYLPLLVPQTGFVFGLQFFFLKFGLDATFIALIFVHLIFVLPYVFLSLSDPWRTWDKRYGNIASAMGTSDNGVFWKVRLPMLVRTVLIAAAVGFSVSIAQYLPTISIGAGRIPTITTEAIALASGGDRRIIGVYAFLQMLLPLVAFLLAGLIPAVLYRNRRGLKVG